MFEFELKGGMDELRKMEGELLDYLGFNRKEDGTFPSGDYDDVCKTYGLNVETDELENEHEERLGQDHGPIFNNRTSLKERIKPEHEAHDSKVHSNKIDVIMHGIETIGSAERSTDPETMRDTFYTMPGGEYANTLFAQFGKVSVEKELEEPLLSLPPWRWYWCNKYDWCYAIFLDLSMIPLILQQSWFQNLNLNLKLKS